MKPIRYLGNIPAPYTIDFLNELGKQVTLTAVFERARSSERDKSWQNFQFKHFKGRILKGFPTSKDSAFTPHILFHLGRRSKEHLIIGNPLTPTGILAILWLKLWRRPYVIISEGGIPGSGKGFKEGFKRIILKNAALYLSGASLGDQYFLQYGAKETNIVRYPFASFHQKDLIKDVPNKKQKETLKQSLNLKQEKMVLFVGRFIPSKGIEVLLNAVKGLNDIDVVLIGGEATDEYLEIVNTLELDNIHFHPFVSRDTLKTYYQAADLFVLPTFIDTYGLVINEAMSQGLPIITTDHCVAGVELIEEGINGYLVPIKDVNALRVKMQELLANDTLRQTMALNNLQKIQHHTIESMAQSLLKSLTSRL